MLKQEGHLETVSALLEGGASPVLADARGNFPLFVCAGCTARFGMCGADDGGHSDVARRLLLAGADADQAGRGANLETALMAASAAGHAEVVRALLEHGVLPLNTEPSRQTLNPKH